MPPRCRILLICPLVLALSACSTTQTTDPDTPPPVAENPAILQAELDLQQAHSLEAEWLIRLSPSDEKTLSLTTVLEMARVAQNNGDTDRATALAQQVIRFTRLGIQQAEEQQNATPFYPQ